MARKGYDEVVAEHISGVVADRQIDDVLHFTRLDRLSSILLHGLRTRAEVLAAGINLARDPYDEEDRAVSVSISCFYPKMFEAKRQREGYAPSVILILEPHLLWKHHCLFHRNGVITNEAKYARGKRFGGYALERLFDDYSPNLVANGTGFRDLHGLPRDFPTFSDAEVQVMSAIDSDYVKGAWVETAAHAVEVQKAFDAAGRADCVVVTKSFEPRVSSMPFSWG